MGFLVIGLDCLLASKQNSRDTYYDLFDSSSPSHHLPTVLVLHDFSQKKGKMKR